MPFTFKKQPRSTGLARVTERVTRTEVKLKGKLVGLIEVPRMFEDNVRVSLRIKCDEHPGWRWGKLRAGFDSEEAARATLNAKYDYVLANFNLVPEED